MSEICKMDNVKHAGGVGVKGGHASREMIF